MKLRLMLLAVIVFAFTTSALPACAQAGGTITFDSPADNATLTCSGSVKGTLTANQGYTAVGASVAITGSSGQTYSYNMTRVGNTNQFEFNWDTLRTSEGTYTLVVTGTFINLANGAPSGVPTGARTVTVKHGYKIVRDKTKSFAKVLSPAEGHTVPVAAMFSVETSHQITYERFDDCATYPVHYEFYNENIYNGETNPFQRISPRPVAYLPKRAGEFVFDASVLVKNYVHTGGSFGTFTVTAYTTADNDRGGVFLEVDAHNFTAAQPAAGN